MQNIKNKPLLFLSSVLFVLVLIFGLSFISPYNNQNKAGFKSALLAKKYEVSRINLNVKNGYDLTLYNLGGFWGGEFFDGNDYVYFPVESEKVEELISKSKETISLNKVMNAKSKDDLKRYAPNNSYLSLSFYDESGNCVSDINFGAMNQSMDKIFLWTDKTMTVYTMDSKFVYYLEPDIKFWQDQNLIPKNISGNLDYSTIQNFNYKFQDGKTKKAGEAAIEKFPSLRFSEIITNFDSKDKTLEINIADGKGTQYKYSFYSAQALNGDCYIFNLEIAPSILFTDVQKDFIKKLNYSASISKWTYNSITKLLEEK